VSQRSYGVGTRRRDRRLSIRELRAVLERGAAWAMVVAFGRRPDQVTIMLHSGSRGWGHQVCHDHLRVVVDASRVDGIALPDRPLCCVPLASPEGRRS